MCLFDRDRVLRADEFVRPPTQRASRYSRFHRKSQKSNQARPKVCVYPFFARPFYGWKWNLFFFVSAADCLIIRDLMFSFSFQTYNRFQILLLDDVTLWDFPLKNQTGTTDCRASHRRWAIVSTWTNSTSRVTISPSCRWVFYCFLPFRSRK